MMDRTVLINKKGQVILSGRDYFLSEYRDGLINCGEAGRWGFINLDGKWYIGPRFTYAHPFYEGLAAVSEDKKEALHSLIDTEGNTVIAGPFRGADLKFSEGRCAVWNKGMSGFIDTAGTLVIPYRYYYADHFSEGLVVVSTKRNGKQGYVDKHGVPVIPEKFEIAEAFSNGLASVTVGDSVHERRYGYIDPSGKYVWEPTK